MLSLQAAKLLQNHGRAIIRRKNVRPVLRKKHSHQMRSSQRIVTLTRNTCTATSRVYSGFNHRWLQTRSSSISDFKVNNQYIEISHQGRLLKVNNIWLREHCRCMECFNHTTHQREVDIRSLNVDIVPKQVVLETTGNGKQLCIVWPDGHQSTYSFDWMVNNICTGTNLSDLSKMLRLWDAKRLEDSPPVTVSFGKYISGDEHLKMVLQNLAEYGFAIVTDTPATIEHTQKVAERISIIRETLYGKMYSFTNELEYADTAYSSVALRAHTDTTYFSEPSGLQVFHCISHDGDGGKTLLVDGFQAAQTLKHQHPEYYQILSQVNLSHRFIDNINDFCFEGIGPILQHHPLTRELICIRFNTYDRSTITHLESEDVYNFYQALSALAEQIASEKNEFWIKLWPGSVLIVDNWRVLHGRSSYTGNRKVCGCYLPRDDLISRYRTLLNISV